MGKQKRKQKQQNCSQQNIIVTENFDYQKFADAMFEAQLRANEKANELKEKQFETNDVEWKRIIGYKEYKNDKNWFYKKIHHFRNSIVVLFHMLFFKKNNAKYDVATLAILRLSLTAIFGIFKWFLYLVAIVLVIATFYSFSEKVFRFHMLPLCYSFLSFLIARMIRVAQFEIENMKEREYLISILSAVTSFVAMLLALLALFVSN